MRIIDSSNRRTIATLFARNRNEDRAFEQRVGRIVDRVRDEGDTALLRFAKKFDDARPPLEVSKSEMLADAERVPRDVRKAIEQAAKHIAKVAARQVPRSFDIAVTPGVTVEQRVEPIASVGCYVPGGRFPLPSSLLMTAIPARIAGVRDVIAVCPRPEPAVMAAALEAGVTRLFRMGGAHAVAALAYGTDSIPRVDKIVGPGNRYVAAAKALVSRDCAIDFYAGPTEIVVVAADTHAHWYAADLIAQAEHDPDARSIFITWQRRFAESVVARVKKLAVGRDIVKTSLAAHGVAIVTRSPEEAMALANRLAPEHLVVDRESLARGSITAGALFVGPFTAQALGDYATGSNHVLPTSQAARFRGGLSAADYMRVMSVQRVTRDGLARLAPTALPLARAEGLTGHAESIEARLK
ncbi:MAG: histidinol dehydrogenase [Acidobacteriaceae bacterium]|jgi:histidinol dehydrogenase|nr:histidinol dehydrogenase [Acidobacteriaceae bacterium]